MELHTITIKDVQVHPIIGVYDGEREKGQEIILNLTIRHTRSSLADDLTTTYDYDAAIAAIEVYAASKRPYLIETFAHAVAELCLENETVREVTVEVVKPHALKNGIVSTIVTKNH